MDAKPQCQPDRWFGRSSLQCFLSYYDQDGILLESNYKRVQGRMGTTIQKKKLKIYLTTNYSSTTTTGGSPSQNSYSGMNNLSIVYGDIAL